MEGLPCSSRRGWTRRASRASARRVRVRTAHGAHIGSTVSELPATSGRSRWWCRRGGANHLLGKQRQRAGRYCIGGEVRGEEPRKERRTRRATGVGAGDGADRGGALWESMSGEGALVGRPPRRLPRTTIVLAGLSMVCACRNAPDRHPDSAASTRRGSSASVRDTSQSATGVALQFPDSTDCHRPNDVPLILGRDSLGHYRLNSVRAEDSTQLAEWLEGPFHQRRAAGRLLMVRDPESFTKAELEWIATRARAAGGRIYALDPKCVTPVA